MILFFQSPQAVIYAVQSKHPIHKSDIEKLLWLFGEAKEIQSDKVSGRYAGPRKEMITPWSTNAVEITINMGILGIQRIEEYIPISEEDSIDPMLQAAYDGLDQDIFDIHVEPEKVVEVKDIKAYNATEGLALSQEEVEYLENVSKKLERPLTDSEVFGFSQVNSEHCRHKIFNGSFVIDGEEKEKTLFQLIKETSKRHPNRIVSAYKDNVAFVQGPRAQQFAPKTQDKPDFFEPETIDTVISLKAETHNFPTTVEPFNGAATGAGGEIRDRMAGGTASIPLAGTAVYMTSYPRSEKGRSWEKNLSERPWLYQTPMDILIKASNGASDFGNKFGQPLISGSVLTFEHEEDGKAHGFDKVIMLAGGVGFTRSQYSKKNDPAKGDKIIIMGGDNYRIGMGGSAVSSVATGEFSNAIELNAIQRSNPEMQKRVMNVIRAMAESDNNPIVSIHDHGAGGHLNCLSELVETTGGTIHIDKLPVGDPTLSSKEIIGNESQERMGLVVGKKDLQLLQKISERERAPFYVVGETTGDMHFKFENQNTGEKPVDWNLSYMFGSSPKTILEDKSGNSNFADSEFDVQHLKQYISEVLQLEAVACKDWLTNKVDRSVTGRVAKQQTVGEIQVPLNNVAVMAIDFTGQKGIATSIGHAPVAALANPEAGSRLAIAEAMTNLVWAPIQDGLAGISLSANWMWPAKNVGENDRLYRAVEAVSEFAIDLGVNIPTGKDSLSMTQKYPDGKIVYSPGTVIISSIGECSDINKTVSPDLKPVEGSKLFYIDFSKDLPKLGGSSFYQILNKIGSETPDVKDSHYFGMAFMTLQKLIEKGEILAGHDISSGGLITALLEMTFPSTKVGLTVKTDRLAGNDIIKSLFAENPGVLIQVVNPERTRAVLANQGIDYIPLATVNLTGKVELTGLNMELDVAEMRDTWFKSSYLLDKKQSGEKLAAARFEHYKSQALSYTFGQNWEGTFDSFSLNPYRKEKSGKTAAIIREKGVNGDREMAYSLWLAGFDVKDVHMTDLIAGRETLEDVQMIVFVGGFSNSDVLGSAKGWAGAFLYNEKAKQALDNFYARKDTLSLGVCNGCQLMVELGLVTPEHDVKPKMLHNASHKFESAFVNVNIPENNTVMFKSLAGKRLGVWIAHGEGKFSLPKSLSDYHVGMTYAYEAYPGNPNGSDHAVAGIASADGRHLAIMPHIERSLKPWNWPHYATERLDDEITPWVEAFVNAFNWVNEVK
ncbi:phosphoribosylformylglycinamidine (FGAM) synthase, synthetase domain protein [Belliella baltica DSM 15883]|uniref:Phosphoribosylformylglycinamidine synthase n=1 Tax=Belliella baltica (strain DSM 15883 / CIP 108006 / LMG 21964 / BA134) TaxID=866536 RepID=I3Z6K1_BELBD|nr:phosphoribosylformylglycinamidine synthase [Belliella baltica]AFL84869.1 phosphoribosylformylglycinamidine (FGAM) synthase, synthetase domain protein [Belliella baltica DSM 15883]